MEFDNVLKFHRGGYFHGADYFSGGFYSATKEKKYWLLDDNGKVYLSEINAEYLYVNLIYNGLIKVGTGKHVYYIDYDLNKVVMENKPLQDPR